MNSGVAERDGTAYRPGSNGLAQPRLDRAEAEAAIAGQSRNGGRGMANWPLRWKLVAVFLLPLVAALFLAGLRIADAIGNTQVYEKADRRIELAKTVTQVIDSLQAEREAMSAWMVSGRPADRTQLDTKIQNSLEAGRALRESTGKVDDIDDPATVSKYQQAIARLDSVNQLRKSAGEGGVPSLALLISYQGVNEALLSVVEEFGSDVTDRGLQDRHNAIVWLARVKEYSAQQNAYLHNAAIRNSFEPAELRNIVTAQANVVSAIDGFNSSASPQARLNYSSTVTGPEVSERFTLQQLALQRANAGDPVDVDRNAVESTSTHTIGLVRKVENTLLDDAEEYTHGLVSTEQRELVITSVVIAAGLLLSIILMLLVARSMLRPLRKLRTSALQVADRHLPEAVDRIMSESDPRAAAEKAIAPVPVHTTEEIGQVARAFDVVHGQAVRLAAEQALLRENVNGIFVNLSRRSQRLVERQLGVIDRLESDEQDPDQLASLFELDHLATRLRRNGESLLVLSGAGLAKSVPRPVPAADLIGAAISEIEQYARVEVGQVPEVAVQGLAIHDLVHLMAELLDNATYFAEPDSKVTVRAVVTRRNSLAIQIADHGVGMSEEQLEEANRRLAEPPELDVSVTRRMGLYVVAKLAKRHGIEVRLRENQDIEGGVIARVVVPERLLSPLPQSARPVPAESRAEISRPSLPPIQATTMEHTPPPPSPAEQSGGLVALDQPIRLDDLVSGSTASAAGPFLNRDATEQPAPLPTREAGASLIQAGLAGPRQQPQVQRPEPERAVEPQPPTQQFSSLSMPQNEPRYVPVSKAKEPNGNDGGGSDGSALDDDVPTRRLPIYQSVLSRWFSEAEEASPDDYAAAGTAQESQAPKETAGAQAAGGDDLARGWNSAADEGWQAAHRLLESQPEEITPAGLPKRVPNKHLVPGSISSTSGPDSFTDTAFQDATPQRRGTNQLARSAAAARGRMVSFQRGYTSGRHALQDRGGETNGSNGSSGGEQ